MGSDRSGVRGISLFSSSRVYVSIFLFIFLPLRSTLLLYGVMGLMNTGFNFGLAASDDQIGSTGLAHELELLLESDTPLGFYVRRCSNIS